MGTWNDRVIGTSSQVMFAGIKLVPSSPQASTINGQPLATVNADVRFGTSMDKGY